MKGEHPEYLPWWITLALLTTTIPLLILLAAHAERENRLKEARKRLASYVN